jgi:hypothetical protein
MREEILVFFYVSHCFLQIKNNIFFISLKVKYIQNYYCIPKLQDM